MGERGALCILLMICIIGGAFLLGGLLFSRSVSTILQLVVASFGAVGKVNTKNIISELMSTSNVTGKSRDY